ncbi:MAG: dephospho-CoA kinase [Phycisphaerales bacterium]|jgi:dephospho-CoA kinase
MTNERFLVLGLAGGIGSGKSAVAAVLGELGFVVSDSDAGARAVLERPEVVAELVRAFGQSVLDASGKPDRKAIADAVFGDEARRRTLEQIVHPRLHEQRAQLIEAARTRGAAGVVIDAPLLFEAGVDAECDAVIFVDTLRAVRLARVIEGRGWTEAELARREAAQMPLEEKRRRSQQVVANDGDMDALRARVRAAVEAIRSDPGRP